MTLPIRWLPKMPLFSHEKMHAHPRSLLDATSNFLFKILPLEAVRPSHGLL
jgi:hypothetical protein